MQWIKVMREQGWRQETGGKHQVKMTMQGRRPVTLPDNHRRPYPKGLDAQIRRETRIDGATRGERQRDRARSDRDRLGREGGR